MKKLLLLVAFFAFSMQGCTETSLTEDEQSITEKPQNCPPNDRNCNGIPDNQE